MEGSCVHTSKKTSVSSELCKSATTNLHLEPCGMGHTLPLSWLQCISTLLLHLRVWHGIGVLVLSETSSDGWSVVPDWNVVWMAHPQADIISLRLDPSCLGVCVCVRACVQILERHWLLWRIWPEGPRPAIRRHEIQLPSMGVRIRATRGRGRPQELRCARVLSHIFSDPAGHCSKCNQDHLPKWPASHSAAGEPTSYYFLHGFLQFISKT